MKDSNAIEVRNLKKSFKVYYDKGNSIKEKIIFHNKNKVENRTVLNGISFDVKKGEAIGLIGHNGCGKSTILKLLSKIIYPDEGTIEMRGRVSSLIELGAGFHPDMSGRENIYINASIFGLSRKEIDQRLNTIIEFSELQDYIDNPVRTYSSGMYMRLAFSVAINVDADILLVDEILAVGDAHFQEKCFDKLKEIKRSGTTIVIVSHSLGQIEEICEKTLWIDEGCIRMEGIPFEVHPKYMEYMNVSKKVDKIAERKEERQKIQESTKEKYQTGSANIKKITMLNEAGESQIIYESGKSARMEIEYAIDNYSGKLIYGVDIKKDGWIRAYGSDLKTFPVSDFSIDLRESDYLFYLTNVANTKENLIDVMFVNGECEKTEDKIIIHKGGNMWGPYMNVLPLNYKLEMKVDFPEGKNVVLTITGDSGKTVVNQLPLSQGVNKIPVSLQKETENLEFVINNPDAGDIVIEKILFA